MELANELGKEPSRRRQQRMSLCKNPDVEPGGVKIKILFWTSESSDIVELECQSKKSLG